MKRSKLFIPLLGMATLSAIITPTLASCNVTPKTSNKKITIKNVVNTEGISFNLTKTTISKEEFTKGFNFRINLVAPIGVQYIFVIESISVGEKALELDTNYKLVYQSQPWYFSNVVTVTFNPGMDVKDYSGDISIEARVSEANKIQVLNVDASNQIVNVIAEPIDLNDFEGNIGLTFPESYNAGYALNGLSIRYGTDSTNLNVEELIYNVDYESHTTARPPYITITQRGIEKLQTYYLNDIEILRIEWQVTP